MIFWKEKQKSPAGGMVVLIKNEELAEALMELPDTKREVIL